MRYHRKSTLKPLTPPHSPRLLQRSVGMVRSRRVACSRVHALHPPLLLDSTRSRLRARDGIPGSYDEDCCAITWFPCCYLAQALNHLDILDSRVEAAEAAAAQSSARSRLDAELTMERASAVAASKVQSASAVVSSEGLPAPEAELPSLPRAAPESLRFAAREVSYQPPTRRATLPIESVAASARQRPALV